MPGIDIGGATTRIYLDPIYQEVVLSMVHIGYHGMVGGPTGDLHYLPMALLCNARYWPVLSAYDEMSGTELPNAGTRA
eukprot:2371694-Rhodomonas_salina.3